MEEEETLSTLLVAPNIPQYNSAGPDNNISNRTVRKFEEKTTSIFSISGTKSW
jgi:hypothetical protein